MSLLQLSLCFVTVLHLTASQQPNATDVCSSRQAEQILSALSQLTSTVSELQTFNVQLQKTMSGLETSNAQLQTTVSSLETSNVQLTTSVSRLQTTISELQTSNALLHGEVADMKTTCRLTCAGTFSKVKATVSLTI